VIALCCFLFLVLFVTIFTIALCKAAGRADQLEEGIKCEEER